MEPLPVREFCETFVEATGREAGQQHPPHPPYLVLTSTHAFPDHVQMMALSRALHLNIDIAYLDGHASKVNFVEFRHAVSKDEKPIILLYRQVVFRCRVLFLTRAIIPDLAIMTSWFALPQHRPLAPLE